MSPADRRAIDRAKRSQRTLRWFDQRLGWSPLLRKAMRYVFPDHWSFMLGEIALYAFVVLVATGVYLTLFFEPSHEPVVYNGDYQPLRGLEMSAAYQSVVNISFDVTGGLLIRQTHHWAANVFIGAIALHLMRIFFTGAFRKPRELNYFVGLTMLTLTLPEALIGYGMLDDLLSGMGLMIAYAAGMSVPGVGAPFTLWFWDGEWPGGPAFWPRLFITHVLVLPVIIGALITVHLTMIMRQHHTQHRGPGRTETNVVGSPLWPVYTLRTLGLLLAVAAVLFLLGGLVQINPIWEWGPYHTYLSTNAAQPDYYLGWLIGALRLMPPFEPHVFSATLAPNPFFGGVLFPALVFLFLFAWPFVERRITGDYRRHELLDRPRDNPMRTATGAAVLTVVAMAILPGAFDRVYFNLGIPYEGLIWAFRVGFFLLPVVVWLVTYRVCRELKRSERHPLRGWYGAVVRRSPGGGYEVVEPAADPETDVPPDAPVAEPSPGSPQR